MNKISHARLFMQKAHKGQTRWDGITPYEVHPEQVAAIVGMLFPTADEDLICAALLHDVMEDCGITYGTLETKFGDAVAYTVKMLTFPKACSDKEYVERCTSFPWNASIIKIADILANLEDGPKSQHFIERRTKALIPLIEKITKY